MRCTRSNVLGQLSEGNGHVRSKQQQFGEVWCTIPKDVSRSAMELWFQLSSS
ncbi:MAG: hypothetical protein F6K50_31215 [Moorea sp. SIO3I7]|uniref:hypothetical protein n=1 Tax=Moorena TaxID=1155738 RepID=UPI0013019065|nr:MULTISPECIES: hypothetical protein [Moorena]NEN99784.1 hypothetical protein [Moorena sp. SIO3I7]NEO59594.1 hypothetical protein [Moorena sp. SIO4G2]NEO12511.1 hypothetical protein [Moorena sp. SIO3E8]NEO25293.1 hypothetical protein [Moorena sp. SIO4A5]NEQ01306.1 hypothetical protein [Moorena sp. SIO3F7]